MSVSRESAFLFRVSLCVCVMALQGFLGSPAAFAQGEQAFKQLQLSGLALKLPAWLAAGRNTLSAGGLLAFQVKVSDDGILDPEVTDGLNGTNSVAISLVENQSFIGLTNQGLLQRVLRVVSFRETKDTYSIYNGPAWDTFVSTVDGNLSFDCFWLPMEQRTKEHPYSYCMLTNVYASGVQLHITFRPELIPYIGSIKTQAYAILDGSLAAK